MLIGLSGLLTLVFLVHEPAISGRVVDESGLPLPGVSVTIRGGRSAITTNEHGDYAFVCLGDGTYDLVFELEGFLRKSVEAIVYQYPAAVILNERLKVRSDVGTFIGTGPLVTIQVVSAEDSHPVNAVEVTLSGPVGLNESHTTDECGRTYWIVKPGKYKVDLRKEGFESTSVQISPSNKHLRVQLKLTRR